MSLELHQPITLSKVNIRKKGPADARMLMIDVKLSAVCDPGILAHFDPSLRHFLFSEAGGPRMRNLKPIGWDGEMAHMELNIVGERFIGAVLGKFKFEALPSGRVALQCVASMHPEGRQTAILADLAGEQVDVEIQPEPQLDLQPPAATPAAVSPSVVADPFIRTVNGDLPNEHGVYPEPDETLRWSHGKDYCKLELLALDNGDWIHAITRHFNNSYASSPLKRSGTISLSREGALRAAQSELVKVYSKGTDCGLSSAGVTDFQRWVNSMFAPAPAKPKAARREVAYRHPDNDTLTWSGKGKKPAWVADFISRGGSIDQLKAAA